MVFALIYRVESDELRHIVRKDISRWKKFSKFAINDDAERVENANFEKVKNKTGSINYKNFEEAIKNTDFWEVLEKIENIEERNVLNNINI